MRADAQRNYDKIVDAAREVFRTKGYDAPLDDIAKLAGVGPGTLYRHFACREALIDAVMQAWIDRVDIAVDKALTTEGTPRDVLLAWFESYVQLISQHKGGPAKLTTALGDPASPIKTKCEVLRSAHQRVLERLHDEGALRGDVDALHVARLVGGIATVADQSELNLPAIEPLLQVVVDGLLH